MFCNADKFFAKMSKSLNIKPKLSDDMLDNFKHVLVSGGSSVVWESLIAHIKLNSDREFYLHVIEYTKGPKLCVRSLFLGLRPAISTNALNLINMDTTQ